MSQKHVYGTSLAAIGSEQRIKQYAARMKKDRSTVLYLMPSSTWLNKARSTHYPLSFGTFDDLASAILDFHNMAFLSLTEQERTLFFQRILEAARQEDARSPREKARAYADTYGQIKRLGLSIDAFKESYAACMPTFVSYEAMLEEYHMIDPEQKLLMASRLLTSGKDMPFEVVVEGFYDFSPLQFKLLEGLFHANIPVSIYLPNFKKLDMVEETLADLQTIGYDIQSFKVEALPKVTSTISVIKATSNKEQWTGLTQQIQECASQAGVVVRAEERDEWIREANEQRLQITQSTMIQLEQTPSFKLIRYLLVPPQNMTEHVALFTEILSFYQIKGIRYVKALYNLRRKGKTEIDRVDKLHEQINQRSWKGKQSFTDYLQTLLQEIETLELTGWLEEQILYETDVTTLTQLNSEKQAIRIIQETVEWKIKEYQQYQLEDMIVSFEFFQAWIIETLASKELFVQAGLRNGVESYTWQHLSHFEGERLFVPSMGADQFPGRPQLAGYLQDADLYTLDIPYGKPTQAHFRKKQEAYFEQLFYVAKEIIFSYVEGVDPHSPLLPSSFVERFEIIDAWSFEKRMTKKVANHQEEQKEIQAYWKGRQFELADLPEDLTKTNESIQRLESGLEPISIEATDRLSKHSTVGITALESYARCPIRYSFERLLRVDEPKTKAVGVSHILIGQLVHSIIEWLYKELDVIGLPFSHLSDEKKEMVPDLLKQKLEEEWEEVERESPHVSKLELNLLKQQWLVRLLDWWKAERKHFWDNAKLANMRITSLEKSLQLDMLVGDHETIRLKGKIDRVDQLDQEFIIYDYKTGHANLKMEEEVRTGLKLQLPLYSFTLREQLERQSTERYEAIGASYISLRSPAKRANNGIWKESEVGKGSRFNVSGQCKNKEEELGTSRFLDKYELENKVKTLWRGMTHEFPVKPLDCRDSCPYGPICRVTDEQKEAQIEG
ncbi:PD-(D/E)XK nuclease family protein [Alkalicoccobacillus gibsonii]|uniref:PD-(D/E)XK nuclease family protein n=1 Tax=Alkalicoccobacillus gibsonii TaxID=79881 RepID=UPI003516272A